MKRPLALFFVAVCAVATAQTAEKSSNDAAMDQERARIAAERRKVDAQLKVDEAACYKQFAVNQCLAKVRAENHKVSADLRRQEIALNDARRREKGMAQQARIDQKEAERRSKPARPAAGDADARSASRTSRAETEQARAEMRRSNQQDKQRSHDAELGDRADRAAAAPANRALYEQKLQKAAAHRAEQEKRNRERTKPPAAGLPTPPAPAALH
jgi:colicin import membrane protein